MAPEGVIVGSASLGAVADAERKAEKERVPKARGRVVAGEIAKGERERRRSRGAQRGEKT